MKQNLLFRQIALCLCCMILSTAALQAQHALKVTGPKAKNAKVWDKQQKSTIVSMPLLANHLQGPMRKNTNFSVESSDKASVLMPIHVINSLSLTGPKFKNMSVYERLVIPQHMDSIETKVDSLYQWISQ